jgi:transcriptional regulator with XRE-family HTH domain
MVSIGTRIRNLRIERKMTQEELADILNAKFSININKGMISKWEGDKTEPRMDYAKNLAQYFNVSLDYLIGVSEDRGTWSGVAPANVEATERTKKFINDLKKLGLFDEELTEEQYDNFINLIKAGIKVLKNN